MPAIGRWDLIRRLMVKNVGRCLSLSRSAIFIIKVELNSDDYFFPVNKFSQDAKTC